MFNNRQFPARPDAPCPLPRSTSVRSVRYLFRHRAYRSSIQADTWLTSWGADGNLYSTYADGQVHGVGVQCTIAGVDDWYYPAPHVGYYAVPDAAGGWGDAEHPPRFAPISSLPSRHTTSGNAVITGDDPFDLQVRPLPPTPLELTRYPCCYPTGCLVKDGLWFSTARYCGHFVDARGDQECWSQGPSRLRLSRDRGASWEWSPFDDRDPLFPEHGECTGAAPVRFGSAHFVDLGRNMEHSPDGYAYLVGHGTAHAEGFSNWSTGDAVFLARVLPTPEAITTRSAYQYFAGLGADGAPTWTGAFSDLKPVIQWTCRCAMPYITYFPAIGKYLALICAGWPNGAGNHRDTWIAEADALWGPWSFVDYWDTFGWFAQIPSKFIGPDGRFVIFTSGGWPGPKPIPNDLHKEPRPTDCPSSTYTLCVGEFRIEG